ncbi:MAG: hypothetical protein JXA22_07965 [Candidatus Thermoplasmatota archaeon]|nr:hypothetical protein [Candidatus Thermoplasmatota archaeon]
MVKKFSILIIIILLLLIPGCINDENNTNYMNKRLSYNYEVEVSNINSTNDFIYVPFPLYASNDTIVEPVLSTFHQISGICDYSFINTDYGIAINFSSSSEAFLLKSEGELHWEYQFSKEPAPIILSMIAAYEKPNWITISEKYWIYSTNQNISLNIKMKTSNDQGGYTDYSSQIIHLTTGWQIIDIKESIKVP